MPVDLNANKEMLDMMVDFLLSAHTGVHWDSGKPSTPTEHTLKESKKALIDLINNDKKVTIKNTELTVPNMDPPINMWGKDEPKDERLKIGINLESNPPTYDIFSEGALEAFGVEGGKLTKEQKIEVVEDYHTELEQIANPQDGEGRPDDEPEMSDFQKRLQKMNQPGYKAPKRRYMGKTERKLNRSGRKMRGHMGMGRRNKSKKRRKSRRGRKSRKKSKKSRRKRRRTRRRLR